jgi:general secretion pathway protein N
MTRSPITVERVLMAAALTLLVLIALVLSGTWRSADWLPAEAAPRQAIAAKTPVLRRVELPGLANAWQAPLFSVDRRPDIAQLSSHAASSLSGLTLTGVLLDGNVQLAFVKPATGPGLKVRLNGQLPNGWTLQAISPSSAIFTLGERTETLTVRRLRLPAPSTQPPLSLSREDLHEPAP